MNSSIQAERILRTLAFALRHDPWQFGLSLDHDGFTDLDELVVAFRFHSYDWAMLNRGEIEVAIQHAEPGRFELSDNRIRALYGHSIRLESPGKQEIPPDFLYHGTGVDSLHMIQHVGLRSMNRAFVHLTSNPEYAAEIVAAKGGGVVLHIHAKAAHESGIAFLHANPHVWLVRELPAEFVVPSAGSHVDRPPVPAVGELASRCDCV
jgi:putative RNA 2'-phosphotransferase